MPRLGSKKSRNGCQQCKARRVKCDEGRPCANCSRYNVECSLVRSQPPASHASSASPQARRVSNGASASPAPSSSTSFPEGRPIPPPSEVVSGGWIEDLELMHHYTAHAHLTMPGVDAAKQIWGYAVPQEAMKYRFLMHTILAFAANHLAHINPSRGHHYRLLGSTHHTAALTGLNQEISIVGMSTENCHALFASASLIIFNAFADTDDHNLDSLLEIFSLCRGMNHILHTTEHIIEKGPFSVVLRPVTDPPKPPPLLSNFLVDIQALAGASEPGYLAQGNSAAEGLREALQHGIERSGHPALRAVTLWPMTITQEYFEALKARTEPTVVSLFRQYCRLLEYAGTEWWFLSGWRNVSQHFLLHS